MTNLPDLPAPAADLWARFSADPRTQRTVRASDADRDIAAEALNAAYSDGRLDVGEHSDRLAAALGAKQLGELVPLLEDITVSTRPKAPRTPAAKARRVQDGAVRTWLGMAILFNVIWVATWLFSGDLPYYYWPVWPMIGTGIPALITWMGAGAAGRRGHDPEALEPRAQARDKRRLERGR